MGWLVGQELLGGSRHARRSYERREPWQHRAPYHERLGSSVETLELGFSTLLGDGTPEVCLEQT